MTQTRPPRIPLQLYCPRTVDHAKPRAFPMHLPGRLPVIVLGFILMSCEVPQVPIRDATTLWLRIERRPSHGGVAVLLNKPKPATDTVQVSTTLSALREPCDSRDSISYYPTDRPREPLKLKHIAEMCQFFARQSDRYSLFGANCRWLCYALLECLRECPAVLRQALVQLTVRATHSRRSGSARGKESLPEGQTRRLLQEPTPYISHSGSAGGWSHTGHGFVRGGSQPSQQPPEFNFTSL